MKTIVINGFPLCGRHSGIHRFMIECLIWIDTYLSAASYKIELVYPWKKRIYVPRFKNIKVKRIWTMSDDWYGNVLPNYLNREDYIFCGMANEIPCGQRNIICLHDLIPIRNEAHFPESEVKERVIKFRNIANKSEVIVTVSETSKRDICTTLNVPDNKVKVIYNSWEHMRKIKIDERIFDANPRLKSGAYYYALGSVMPHKNFEWIARVAQNNPSSTFAIAGDLHRLGNSSLFQADNIIYLGRVTDEENKALMVHCKAFLHPAFCEGFGIPPLEALSCGASIIISDISCLPEIYGESAHYISPYKYEYNLDAILNEPVVPPDQVLRRYSWETSAQRWLDIFDTCANG